MRNTCACALLKDFKHLRSKSCWAEIPAIFSVYYTHLKEVLIELESSEQTNELQTCRCRSRTLGISPRATWSLDRREENLCYHLDLASHLQICAVLWHGEQWTWQSIPTWSALTANRRCREWFSVKWLLGKTVCRSVKLNKLQINTQTH